VIFKNFTCKFFLLLYSFPYELLLVWANQIWLVSASKLMHECLILWANLRWLWCIPSSKLASMHSIVSKRAVFYWPTFVLAVHFSYLSLSYYINKFNMSIVICASTQVNVLSLYGEARRFTCSTQLCIALGKSFWVRVGRAHFGTDPEMSFSYIVRQLYIRSCHSTIDICIVSVVHMHQYYVFVFWLFWSDASPVMSKVAMPYCSNFCSTWIFWQQDQQSTPRRT